MQQKYLHQHHLSKNLINNKTRQQMYLKHLREVEKINNRQAETLKSEIKHYRSISEVHKKNKIKAYQFKLRQHQKQIEQKNVKIFGKISTIGSDQRIKNLHSSHVKSSSLDNSQTFDKSKQKIQIKNNQEQQRQQNINRRYAKQSFHYQYRKRRQQQIQNQNSKLMKAILHQKSTILPLIRKSHQIKSTNQIEKTKQKSMISNQQSENKIK